jgi:ligand-binding sensor domain-containing protein
MAPRSLAFYSLFILLPYLLPAQLQPIGQWRDHLPYQQVTGVACTADKVWACTPYSLFSVDAADNTIEKYSSTNGLSETGISAIGAEAAGKRLVVAYNNSNIDVVNDDNDIININAVKNTSFSGDKTIYTLYIDNARAYVCTGFGIVVIDLDKYEVKDTYIIGSNGSRIRVNAVTRDQQYFYAATAEGIKKAPVTGANLADYHNWQTLSGSNGLPAGEALSVTTLQNNILAVQNNSVWLQTGNTWAVWYTDGWTITNTTVSNNKLLISETRNNTGRVVVLNPAGATENTIQNTTFINTPQQAAIYNNEYWIADSTAGLVKFSGAGFTPLLPNAPAGIATAQMQVLNNTLWAAAGTVTSNWEPTGNKNGLFTFSNGTWASYNRLTMPALDTIPDMVSVAIDPVNGSLWAGSFGGGLVNITTGNTLTVLKQHSPVAPAYFNTASYRVSGLAFDADNNLWVANYGADQPVRVKKADGSWQSFSIPFVIAEQAVSQVVIDDLNQKWIVLPKGNGLVCFNHGQSIDNTGDDKWKLYQSGKGNGNLPDNNVLCIAKDKNSFIWVGTAKGIGVIECVQDVFGSTGCDAVLPVVQQDNFAGYLFADEQVQAIAVDGADRKWVGTQNGAWLISSDGDKTIYQFTESNSPLLSNDVKQIAIDNITGEVFFATAKGICSFRSTATETTPQHNTVLAFPNPVPPGYSGTIAIRGLPNNAIVKITELNGRLLYQTRALGGQAIWNGKDYKGRTASTGVYLVLVSDDTHQQKLVTKIVFVQK